MRHPFPLLVQAVAFDLDGTLLDTADDIAEGVHRMLDEMKLPRASDEEVRAYIGNGVGRLVKRALTGSMHGEPDETLFERALPIFRKHYFDTLTRSSRPYPGVVETLEQLREQGFRMACITNKAEQFTLPLLEATGLAPFFQAVLSGDSLPARKPDPLPLTHTCEQFGIAPRELLMVGDSWNDTQAARAAGCPVFLVPYGYDGGVDVHDQNGDAVIDNLLDCLKLIRKPAL